MADTSNHDLRHRTLRGGGLRGPPPSLQRPSRWGRTRPGFASDLSRRAWCTRNNRFVLHADPASDKPKVIHHGRVYGRELRDHEIILAGGRHDELRIY